MLRRIFLFERVSIVHGHSAFSTLCHEALLCASCMGLQVSGLLSRLWEVLARRRAFDPNLFFVFFNPCPHLQTVYTDHSLLEMTEVSNRIIAKLLNFTLTHTLHAICVSHTWLV